MHDEVSETENIRKNLSIERMIIEGCDILLDVNQTFVRQGELSVPLLFSVQNEIRHCMQGLFMSPANNFCPSLCPNVL